MLEEEKEEEIEWWEYGPSVTAYDLVGNNFFTRFVRSALYIAIRFYFRFYHQLKVMGNIPDLEGKSYIIISNHSSHLDTPLIFSCFPLKYVNRIRALAAKDYFFSNPLVRILTHLLCNLIPISRKSADFTSISMCNEMLKKGNNVVIYPEGTRTRNGIMGEFKPGVGIFLKKECPSVLPVYIKGTYKAMNYKMKYPHQQLVEITFGNPIVFNRESISKMSNEEIAEKIQKEVVKLSKEGDM